MSPPPKDQKPATASEIRAILGPSDESLVVDILKVGATYHEVLEAYAWITSDDYLHRKLLHNLHGRAAEVFDILESELPEPDEG